MYFIAIAQNQQGHRSTIVRVQEDTAIAVSGWPRYSCGYGPPTGQVLGNLRKLGLFDAPSPWWFGGGSLPPARANRYTDGPMANPIQPNVKLTNTGDYRENYANSVQIRVNVWDFFLVFGTLLQQSETQVEIQNFQGIYLSPQQAKALLGILQHNVAGYESAFGEIKLDPRMMQSGPVH
jgi:hypothetical protein